MRWQKRFYRNRTGENGRQMQLTFIANACSIVEKDGFSLLTDPWLIDGVFDGAWFHYPPLKTIPQDLQSMDALYISHLHPDHYDEKTLKYFRKDIPIICLKHGQNYLQRMLRQFGFTHIIDVEDGKSVTLGPFTLTLYAPFAKHVFFDSFVGNLLDSAICIETAEHTLLNTNDNTPTIESCARLLQNHKTFTCVQLNYNAAGPYPSCFNNLSDQQKVLEHNNIIQRNLAHMVAVGNALHTRYIMPFAGAYVIGGSQWKKNHFLGTTTSDRAGEYIRKHSDKEPLLLREGNTFDFDTNAITHGTYQPLDIHARDSYIEQILSQQPYEYENDPEIEGSSVFWEEALPESRKNLWEFQKRFHAFFPTNFYLELPDRLFHFAFDKPEVQFTSLDIEKKAPFLLAKMDLRLLKRILLTKSHWNNAEIGCHIDFIRSPNIYIPDMHTLLSFFHLPKKNLKSLHHTL